jgi:hypothetical protein
MCRNSLCQVEWKEAKPPKRTPGPIYNFRRGYNLSSSGRHETADQYAAFQVYLKLNGNRTFIDTAKLSGYDDRTIARWCKTFCWESRAARWDRDQMAIVWKEAEALKRNAHKEAIVEFRDAAQRQAEMMSKVSEDLVGLLSNRIEKAIEKKEDIPMGMVAGLLKAASSVSEQSRQAWANSLGVNELLSVVDSDIQQVRVDDVTHDPYEFEIEE